MKNNLLDFLYKINDSNDYIVLENITNTYIYQINCRSYNNEMYTIGMYNSEFKRLIGYIGDTNLTTIKMKDIELKDLQFFINTYNIRLNIL